jgi:hypothetical protein
MPLNIQRLANLMETQIKVAIKTKEPKAKPGIHLKKMCLGVATGFVLNVVGTKGKISPTGALGTPTVGMRGLNPLRLAALMKIKSIKAFGGNEGPALQFFVDGISKAIVIEMGLVTVMGTDAGLATGFGAWKPKLMGQAMMRATGFKPTKYNAKFFQAIAEAITEEIKKNGTVTIPPSGPGSGGAQAVLA